MWSAARNAQPSERVHQLLTLVMAAPYSALVPIVPDPRHSTAPFHMEPRHVGGDYMGQSDLLAHAAECDRALHIATDP
jgi:hypothetical protein